MAAKTLHSESDILLLILTSHGSPHGLAVTVITAADANHASFGCEDKAKWTYFGDALFNVALRRTANLKDAFILARSLVLKRELREGFDPSHPQMAGGGNVEPLLARAYPR
jgi:hypothetical protein